MLDLYTSEREWKESRNGNYYALENDRLVATVFRNEFGYWFIIINGEPLNSIVADEHFKEAEEGTSRADEILDCAECMLKTLSPKRYG